MRDAQIKVSSSLQNAWVERLPGVVADRALICARERDVPLELSALAAIAAVSVCVGRGLVVNSAPHRVTRGNLFILLSVPSGIGKSEVFRDLFEPVLGFEEALHGWWKEEAAPRARGGDELLKAAISGIRSDIRKFGPSLTSFRRLQEHEKGKSVCRRFLLPPSLLADDSTPEALAEMMSRSTECIATVSADARNLLKRLVKGESREEALMLKAFSGDLMLTSRISRQAVTLRQPCLSALMLTQPDSYESFLQKAVRSRSGLLPRFLHREIQLHGRVLTTDLRRASSVKREYGKRLVELIETFRFESEPAVVRPTRRAREFLNKIERECRSASIGDETTAGEVLRRRAEQAWHVALCLHAARHGRLSALKELALEDAETSLALVDQLTRLDA